MGRRVIREAERYGEGTQRRLVPEIYRLAVCSSATLLTRVIGNLANIIEISFAWQSVLTWTARKALHAVTEALAEALAQKGTMHDDQTAPDLLHRSGPVCGDAFAFDFTGSYNFMSVLTHTQGRAVVGPRTNVCGFNSENWNGGPTPWDQPIDWPTTNLVPGPQTFTWNISWGPHFSDTQEFRYWITKPDFEFRVGQPLSFSDFEDTPFCVLTYDDANPDGNPLVVPDHAGALFHTTCTVPQRAGRHVIYAEWGRNQWTFERFHTCVDAVFDGGAPAIDAVIALSPDVREFTGTGTITLNGTSSVGEGLSYQWSVDSVNPASHSISNADQAMATLNLADVQAASMVNISLVVTNQTGTRSDSASITLLHRPSVSSPWLDLGPIAAQPRALTAGDRLSVRTVQDGGQDVFYPNQPVALTAASAAADAWPFELAQAVNAQNGNIRIGVLDAQNQVAPTRSATANRIYALTAADVTGAFLQVVSGPSSCLVNYRIISQWGNGFQADVTITNPSTIPVFGYSLGWTMGSGESLNNGWNATFAPNGSALSASNTAGHWNGVIRASGGAVSFGFIGNKGGESATIPNDFRLNGLPCTTATPAAPAPGAVISSGGGANGSSAFALALFFCLLAAPAAWLLADRTRRALATRRLSRSYRTGAVS